MAIRCIVCGKPSQIESFCNECWLRQRKLFDISGFEIKICDCGSYLHRGQWLKFHDFDGMVKEMIIGNIITDNRINRTEIRMKKVGNKITAYVKGTGLIRPCKSEKTETKEIVISIRTVKCEECKQHLASYYEAVIQLREEDLLEKIISDGGESVINVLKVRGGHDIYFFRDNVASRIVEKLRKKGYSITKSNVFVVQKNNKKIYRNYYSVKAGGKDI